MSQASTLTDKTRLGTSEPNRARRGLIAAYLGVLMIAFAWWAARDLEKRVFWADEGYTVLMLGPGFYAAGDLFNREIEPGKVYSREQIRTAFDIKDRTDTPILGTLQVLTTQEHRHVPLYFSLASIWCKLFGTTVGALRSLSLIFAVLQIPAMYWFASSLLRSRLGGCIGAALVAGSPFHMIYAQEARPYSLWALLTMVCSSLLLVAMRRNRIGVWVGYGVSLVAMCYTHMLALTTVAAQAVFVWTREGWRKSDNWRRFLISAGIACATAVPWAIVGAIEYSHKPTNYTHIPVTPQEFAGRWLDNLTLLFCSLPSLPLNVIVVLEIVAIALLFVPKDKTARNFLLPMILFSVAPLLVPDLIQGGQRSLALKYMTPAVVAGFAAVTSALTAGLLDRNRWAKIVSSICLTLILGLELGSAAGYYYSGFNRKVPGEFVKLVRQLRMMKQPAMVIKSINVVENHRALYGKAIAMDMAFAAPINTQFVYYGSADVPAMPKQWNEAIYIGWNRKDLAAFPAGFTATKIERDLWLVSNQKQEMPAESDMPTTVPESESEDN